MHFFQVGPINLITLHTYVQKKLNGQINAQESPTQRPQHYAYVEFVHQESVTFACEILHGVKLYGEPIFVRPAHIQREKPSRFIAKDCVYDGVGFLENFKKYRTEELEAQMKAYYQDREKKARIEKQIYDRDFLITAGNVVQVRKKWHCDICLLPKNCGMSITQR